MKYIIFLFLILNFININNGYIYSIGSNENNNDNSHNIIVVDELYYYFNNNPLVSNQTVTMPHLPLNIVSTNQDTDTILVLCLKNKIKFDYLLVEINFKTGSFNDQVFKMVQFNNDDDYLTSIQSPIYDYNGNLFYPSNFNGKLNVLHWDFNNGLFSIILIDNIKDLNQTLMNEGFIPNGSFNQTDEICINYPSIIKSPEYDNSITIGIACFNPYTTTTSSSSSSSSSSSVVITPNKFQNIIIFTNSINNIKMLIFDRNNNLHLLVEKDNTDRGNSCYLNLCLWESNKENNNICFNKQSIITTTNYNKNINYQPYFQSQNIYALAVLIPNSGDDKSLLLNDIDIEQNQRTVSNINNYWSNQINTFFNFIPTF